LALLLKAAQSVNSASISSQALSQGRNGVAIGMLIEQARLHEIYKFA
jgi:hypothetical protein